MLVIFFRNKLHNSVRAGIFIALFAFISMVFVPTEVSALGPLMLAVVGSLAGVVGGALIKVTLGSLGLLTLFTASSVIAEWLLQISLWVLVLASILFDTLMKWAVVDFSSKMVSLGIFEGITTVWSAFRDISNIIIIGMFVFVAMSFILGVKEFGTKKWVVRIIIVATLINFSLFFTKTIIGASHTIAKQFYKGIATEETLKGPSLIPKSDKYKIGGVAGGFLAKIGIQSWADEKNFSKQLRLNNPSILNGKVMIFFYTATVVVLIASVATVLGYGAYLLLVRAILLIFLLMTSSLAFASYLVPKYSNNKYGWSGWWNTLIRTSVFAPLLMMLLWASLTVLNSVNADSIAKALLDPTGDSFAETFIVILITIAMLYASIKISESISNQVSDSARFMRDIAQRVANGGMKYGAYPFKLSPGISNIAKYGASASARKSLETGSGAVLRRKLLEINSKLNNKDFKGSERKRALKDRSRLERKLTRLNNLAGGRFEKPKIAKKIDDLKGVWAKGAGPGGADATADKASMEEFKQAEMITKPREAERKDVFDKVKESRESDRQNIRTNVAIQRQAERDRAELEKQKGVVSKSSAEREEINKQMRVEEHKINVARERISEARERLSKTNSPSDMQHMINKMVGDRAKEASKLHYLAKIDPDNADELLRRIGRYASQSSRSAKSKETSAIVKALKDAMSKDNPSPKPKKVSLKV